MKLSSKVWSAVGVLLIALALAIWFVVVPSATKFPSKTKYNSTLFGCRKLARCASARPRRCRARVHQQRSGDNGSNSQGGKDLWKHRCGHRQFDGPGRDADVD